MKGSTSFATDDYFYYSPSSSSYDSGCGGSGEDSSYESRRSYSRPKCEEFEPTGSYELESAYRRREAALAAAAKAKPAKEPLSVRFKDSLEDFVENFFIYILPTISAVFLFGLYVYAEVMKTQGM